MIKLVLQVIPFYVMRIFLLPTLLINTIEKIMNLFWWGHKGSKNRGIQWMSWEKLAMNKNYGSM